MKVVLFCGGLGLRVKDLPQGFPKTLLPIGGRPILWHIMKYYASFGHNEFIICLGYRAKFIVNYFANLPEIEERYTRPRIAGIDARTFYDSTEKWTMTFVNTGLFTNIGQRLKFVQAFLKDEEIFLANYGDNLSDAPMDQIIDEFKKHSGKTACFISVRPNWAFHVIECLGEQTMKTANKIRSIASSDIRVNGGFFVFRKNIFDVLSHGRDLVEGAFQELIKDYKLLSWQHDGFWIPLDTAKDYFRINHLCKIKEAHWMIWRETKPAPSVSSDVPYAKAEN